MRTLRSGDHRKSKPGQSEFGGPENTTEILFTGEFKPAPASYAEFPSAVHPEVAAVLMHAGRRRPYSHQAETAHAILCRHTNVGLVTPTASGKTVAFLTPVLTMLVDDPDAVAILTYPTKALAADQFKGLRELGFTDVEGVPGVLSITIDGQDITVGVLDGDTTEKTRSYLREHGRIILSNPPAIHQIMLRNVRRTFPDGTHYGRIVRNLRIFVVDEGHFYHGSSGTQAAFAFRRLFALVDMLTGNPPLVIVATATIGNPLEHLQALTGLSDFHMVTTSGAARHRRVIHITRPAEYTKAGELRRYSVTRAVTDLALAEITAGRVVLIFTNSRAGADSLASQLGNAVMKPDSVAAFHSGIPREDRKDILERLFSGAIRCLLATSALELGIDLGNLDTVIAQGHPGDNASFGQRCGRVGRTREGTVYLVLNGRNEMDVYLNSNPKAAFWPPESRTIYTDNRIAKTLHAACAMLETRSEAHIERWFGDIDWQTTKTTMLDQPHDKISMIGLGNLGKTFLIDPAGKQIGELSTVDALKDWHFNAILRSPSGRFYRVSSADFDQLRVITRELRPEETDLNTAPLVNLTATPIGSPDAYTSSLAGAMRAICGDYDVKRETVGFYQVQTDSRHRVVSRQLVDLLDEQRNPAFAFETRGVEVTLGGSSLIAQCCAPGHFPGTTFQGARERPAPEDFLQVLVDVLRRTVPIVLQARSEDVELSAVLEGATITFLAYDVAEGGMGWSEALFRSRRWFSAAAELLIHCECNHEGCPRCTMIDLGASSREELAQALHHAIER